MTDTFREIEKGHEAKYKLDEETRFKIVCRRDKLLGLWAANKLGLTDAEADGYARDLVRRNLGAPTIEGNVQRLIESFTAGGLNVAEVDIRQVASDCQAEAESFVRDRFPHALDTDHAPIGG